MVSSSKIVSPDTSSGFNWIIRKAFGDDDGIDTTTEAAPTVFSIGVSSQTISESDDDCISKVPIDYTSIDECDATTDWNHGGTGLQVTLNNDDELVGTGCLNLISTAGTATWTKDIGAGIDLSASGTGLHLFMYISASTFITPTTDTVSIILGTGGVAAANQYDFSSTDLKYGEWFSLNILDLTDYDSQIGVGATLSDIDNIKIQVKVAVANNDNDIIMDEWLYAVAAGYTKAFVTGYPTMNSTQHHIRYQLKILANEANGFYLTESVLKNVTPKAFQRSTFTGISKGVEKEVRILNTIRFKNL